MISKAKLQFLRSLHLSKFRQGLGKFLIEGEKMALEGLRQATINIDELFALEPWLAQYQPLLLRSKVKCHPVNDEELKKISLLNTPNQVLMVAQKPADAADAEVLKNDLSIFLDGIQDPGNAGTILRIADWFGIRQVIFSPDSVEPFHPKVVQASMGAIYRVHLVEAELSFVMKLAPGLDVIGAALDGENLFEMIPVSKGILVIGNEARGLSEKVQSCISRKVFIPRHPAGGAESLNAAVAAGIICAVLRNR